MQLSGITVWDGDRILGACEVTVREGTFSTVTATGEPPRGAFCLLPGLVDTHVHLVESGETGAGNFYTWRLTTTREEQVLHGLAHALQALRGGVTTVRDLAADVRQVALAHAIDEGLLVGPRIVTHGMVGMTAGHEDLFTPSAVADRPPTADGVDACRRLVRVYARDGLNGIKIATSGGVLSMGDRNSWRNHTDDEIAAIVDESHALGMDVAAHAHTSEGIARALQHGVDSLEHGTLITPDLATQAAAAGVTVAPTLLINDRIASGAVPTSATARAKAEELVRRRDELMAEAVRRGARFVLGTDANGYHVAFGDQMEELRRMHEVLGLQPEDVLRAGTSWAAKVVGLADTVGRVAPGFAADALILKGHPWEDLEELRVENIVAVIARGALVHGSLPQEVTA